MKKTILHLATVLLLAFTSNAQKLTPDNWTDYTGWHVGEKNIPAWGGWVREFAPNKTGLGLVDSTTMKFNPTLLDSLYNKLALLDTAVDILELDGGIGSARDTAKVKAYMNMIERDSAAFWKDIVYKQCYKLAQLPNSKNRMYYQLGNEITSPAYSQTIRYWKGQGYTNGQGYDQFIIPYFVENFIAPTIEAIDSASSDYFGQKGMINICMGSITNAASPVAKMFLDSLLNYTIKGTYASSLTGKKVYELIHIITIHYMMGTDLTSKWESTIDSYTTWFGKGRIRGVWSTEEVGIKSATRGDGAATGARATARYLKWSIDNKYAARTARTNYYAWDNGPANTKVNDFNNDVYNFLGKVKLQYVDSLNTTYSDPSKLEWHGFLNESLNKGILITLLANTNPASSEQNISQITFAKSKWGVTKSVTLTNYDTLGNRNIPVTLTYSQDSVTVSFAAQGVNRQSVLLMKINTESILSGIRDRNNQQENALSLYPNPVTNELNIEILHKNKRERIEILNMVGQRMYSSEFNGQSTLDVSSFPSGMYIVRISDDSTSTVQQFVKE